MRISVNTATKTEVLPPVLYKIRVVLTGRNNGYVD